MYSWPEQSDQVRKMIHLHGIFQPSMVKMVNVVVELKYYRNAPEIPGEVIITGNIKLKKTKCYQKHTTFNGHLNFPPYEVDANSSGIYILSFSIIEHIRGISRSKSLLNWLAVSI